MCGFARLKTVVAKCVCSAKIVDEEMIALTILLLLFVLCMAVLLIAYVCFRMAFYVPEKTKQSQEEYPLPEGKIYEPYREKMIQWMQEVRATPCEDMVVQSFDGLTLRGRYYEYAPGAPIELMFHGYRGRADRDLCGGMQRCFALGHSALIVDQRACGSSEGNVITFGVNESRDCRTWLDYAIDRFGQDCKIILCGISMGASTVLMAAGRYLPENVIGVLADCGYTSARDIIQKVIQTDMHLPPKLAYPFVRLGAKLFGHFDLEETPAVEAVTRCTVPVIFFHGESDDFVPCQMSVRNYEACSAQKKHLVTVPGAGHGLSYPVSPKRYLQEMREFFGDPVKSE